MYVVARDLTLREAYLEERPSALKLSDRRGLSDVARRVRLAELLQDPEAFNAAVSVTAKERGKSGPDIVEIGREIHKLAEDAVRINAWADREDIAPDDFAAFEERVIGGEA